MKILRSVVDINKSFFLLFTKITLKMTPAPFIFQICISPIRLFHRRSAGGALFWTMWKI